MKIKSRKKDFDNILSGWGEALAQPKSDITRDSAILRFELTFEVAWKLVQVLVRAQGFEANSPRQAFQQAFTLGWISNEEIWADIIRARNTAVHVYRQEYAEALYNELGAYHQAFQELQNSLSKELIDLK
jgi:nucleotidyltransferase substrate binding protein (TIGR01987 family)